jgi:hypothetical protein
MSNKKNLHKIDDRLNTVSEIVKEANVDSLIDLNNINEDIENYKKSNDIRELISKRYYDFNQIFQKLNAHLQYLKSGSTGSIFRSVYPEGSNKPDFCMKVCFYPKKEQYGSMYDVRRPENCELIMLKLLSSFVVNKQTPHIILSYFSFTTSAKPFLNLAKKNIVNNKRYDAFLQKYKDNEYYQNVSIVISEFANGGDLLQYLRNNYKKLKTKEWRIIFFQLLSTLAVIQAKYPTFRHNDLKSNNILVQLTDSTITNNKYLYKVNNETYVVPNIGISIKIIDFDFSSIKGVVENSKVDAEWTNRINISSEMNRYYDVHYFFNTLTRKGFFPEFWTEPEIPTKIKDFVNRIIPDKYKSGDLVSERGRILINDEYLTPNEIIKNDCLFKIMKN